MKILQVHNYYQDYGGECHVVDAEKKLLEENGHEVIQYIRRSRDIDSWGVSKKILTLASIPYNLVEYKSLLKFIECVRPDVAHVHNVFPLISPSAYSALAKANVPVIQTVHNYRFLCPNGVFFIDNRVCEDCQTRGLFSSVRKRCMHDSYVISALYSASIANVWRTKNIPNNVSRFIVLNQFVYDKLLAAGISEKKLVTCSNFIDSQNKAVTVKKRYILYLGRLSVEKGVMTLLKAVASLDNVLLKVAGSGPEEQRFKQYVSECAADRVEFVGFVQGEEKERLIAEAICTVFPSECYENCPISVLESLSHGTPVIASNIGGLPDMVDESNTGLLFKPGDYKALAACIRKLWCDQAKSSYLAKNAIEKAKTKFSKEIHIKRIIEIYRAAIEQSL